MMEIPTGHYVLIVGSFWVLGLLIGLILFKMFKTKNQKKVFDRREQKKIATKVGLKDVIGRLDKLQNNISRDEISRLNYLFGTKTRDLITNDPKIRKFISNPYKLGRAKGYLSQFISSLEGGQMKVELLYTARGLLNQSIVEAQATSLKMEISSIISYVDDIWFRYIGMNLGKE